MARRRRSRVVRRSAKPKDDGLLCQSAVECAHSAWSHIKSAEQAGATPANQAQMLFAFGAEVFARFFPERAWPARVVRRQISQSDVDAALDMLVHGSLDFGVSQWAEAMGRISQPLDVASAVATDERIGGTTLDKNISSSIAVAVTEPDIGKQFSMFERIYERYGAVMSRSIKYVALAGLLGAMLVACQYDWFGLCTSAYEILMSAFTDPPPTPTPVDRPMRMKYGAYGVSIRMMPAHWKLTPLEHVHLLRWKPGLAQQRANRLYNWLHDVGILG